MSAIATKPRVAPMYYDTPPKTLPPLPTTPAERQKVMADAIFASVLALQGLLTDRDPHVVMKAAGMILDVDKTQIRHGRRVSGTGHPCPLDPLPGMPGYESPTKSTPSEQPAPLLPTPEKMAHLHRMTDEDEGDFDDDEFNDWDEPAPKAQPKAAAQTTPPMTAERREYVTRVRAALQTLAKEQGSEEVVSWEKAVRVTDQLIERQKRMQKEAADETPKGSVPSSRTPCGMESRGSL